MTFFTHTLLTAAGIQILSLDPKDIILAYAFGVGADLDHLIKLPAYIQK